MKQRKFIAIALVGAAFVLTGCGMTKKVTSPANGEPAIQQPTVEQVTPEPEVISIAEAVDVFEHPERMAETAKKYGYKLKKDYEIYRLDKFSKLFYKNCRLAKILTANQYEDYPKPLRKGVSSYVAFKEGAIIIGVFNQKAYDNLVAQVKAAGYTLDMPGNEDIYVKGSRRIACYAGAKTVRVQ